MKLRKKNDFNLGSFQKNDYKGLNRSLSFLKLEFYYLC